MNRQASQGIGGLLAGFCGVRFSGGTGKSECTAEEVNGMAKKKQRPNRQPWWAALIELLIVFYYVVEPVSIHLHR